MRFAYVEPRLMPLYLKFRSPQQAPSMLTPMTLKEFALRAQRDSSEQPLFYPEGEFYYMQSPVTRDIRQTGHLNFDQPPFSAVLAPGESFILSQHSDFALTSMPEHLCRRCITTPVTGGCILLTAQASYVVVCLPGMFSSQTFV